MTDLHGGDVLGWRNPFIVKAQPFLHLLLHLVTKGAACYLAEAVDPAEAKGSEAEA